LGSGYVFDLRIVADDKLSFEFVVCGFVDDFAVEFIVAKIDAVDVLKVVIGFIDFVALV
jgi:hypothetical protein